MTQEQTCKIMKSFTPCGHRTLLLLT